MKTAGRSSHGGTNSAQLSDARHANPVPPRPGPDAGRRPVPAVARLGPWGFSRPAKPGGGRDPGRARRLGRAADRRRQERLLSDPGHPPPRPGPRGLAPDRPDDRPGRGPEAAGRRRRPPGFRRLAGRAVGDLGRGPVRRSGPAVCLARRPGGGGHDGPAGRTAPEPDRHRRGPLRQPVGARFPSRLSQPGSAGRAVPERPAHRRHRHRRRPHPRRHPALAAARRSQGLRRQFRPPEPATVGRAQGKRLARQDRRPGHRTGA